MKHRVLCDLVGIDYPIFQGALARLSLADLVAAVSNAGGLGVIGSVGIADGPSLRQEIQRTRAMTDRPFGVNIVLSGSAPVDAFLDVVINEAVRVVITSAGNPQRAVPRLRREGVKVFQVVGSVRQALKAVDAGADGVIAEGSEGGGEKRLDGISTMVLVPSVVDAVSVPVIAAGGIVDARGFVAALALGAAGIQMGTRFIASAECPAHPDYKAALVAATEEDTLVLQREKGSMSRVLATPYARHLWTQQRQGAGFDETRRFLNGERNRMAALEGDFGAGPLYAGQSVSLVTSILSVKQIVEGIARGVAEIESELRHLDN